MDPDGDPLFSDGLSLAELAASSNLLQDSWAAISELEPRIDRQHFGSDVGDPTIIKEFHFPKYNIIAYVTSPVTTGSLQEERDLAPSSEIPDFEFLCSKRNPTFRINRAAVSLFNSLRDKLSRLQEKVLDTSEGRVPYVITGHCLGGSIASLFTLWLLETSKSWWNIPLLCITFGSPLLGDSAFQQAVSQNSTWNSCFLHVVHKDDSFPIAFLHTPTTYQSPYKPFGTFLLCSESGGACFEAPESVMELLTSEIIVRDQKPQSVDYKNAIECLKQRIIYSKCSRLNRREADSYKAGVTIQVTAVGLEPIQQENEGNDALIEDIVNHERGVIRGKRETFGRGEEFKKMREYTTLLEWYLKICRGNGFGPGYYDRFKNAREGLNNGVEKYLAILADYWETVVEEAGENPRELRSRFLYAGSKYRMIVEPLDIAEYYRSGRNDYLNEGRSKHYKLLEQWLEDHRGRSALVRSPNLKLPDITEDSCFWAHVEEAIRSCRLLAKGGPLSSSGRVNLINFEDYVMRSINNRAVSPDIFLEKSSYMQWWREYEEILEKQMMGHSHDSQSQLVRFMRERLWRELCRS